MEKKRLVRMPSRITDWGMAYHDTKGGKLLDKIKYEAKVDSREEFLTVQQIQTLLERKESRQFVRRGKKEYLGKPLEDEGPLEEERLRKQKDTHKRLAWLWSRRHDKHGKTPDAPYELRKLDNSYDAPEGNEGGGITDSMPDDKIPSKSSFKLEAQGGAFSVEAMTELADSLESERQERLRQTDSPTRQEYRPSAAKRKFRKAKKKDPDSIDNTPMRTARSKKLRRYRPPLAAAAATRRMASEEIPERRKKSFLPNAEKETEDDKNPLMEELDVEPEFDRKNVTWTTSPITKKIRDDYLEAKFYEELNGPANSWYKASIAELRSKTGEERWSKRLERTFRKVPADIDDAHYYGQLRFFSADVFPDSHKKSVRNIMEARRLEMVTSVLAEQMLQKHKLHADQEARENAFPVSATGDPGISAARGGCDAFGIQGCIVCRRGNRRRLLEKEPHLAYRAFDSADSSESDHDGTTHPRAWLLSDRFKEELGPEEEAEQLEEQMEEQFELFEVENEEHWMNRALFRWKRWRQSQYWRIRMLLSRGKRRKGYELLPRTLEEMQDKNPVSSSGNLPTVQIVEHSDSAHSNTDCSDWERRGDDSGSESGDSEFIDEDRMSIAKRVQLAKDRQRAAETERQQLRITAHRKAAQRRLKLKNREYTSWKRDRHSLQYRPTLWRMYRDHLHENEAQRETNKIAKKGLKPHRSDPLTTRHYGRALSTSVRPKHIIPKADPELRDAIVHPRTM